MAASWAPRVFSRRMLGDGLLAVPSPGRPTRAAPETLRAADGVVIAGDTPPAQGRRRGTILLFPMAGSNPGEYATITPELARRGLPHWPSTNALAVLRLAAAMRR